MSESNGVHVEPSKGEKFMQFVLKQHDFRTIANADANRRYAAAGGEKLSNGYVGAIMAKIRHGKAHLSKTFAAPTAERRTIAEMSAQVPTAEQLKVVFGHMKAIRELKDRIGGYDDLIALATEMRAAGV